KIRKSGDISTRIGEARDEALANGVRDRHKYNWNVAGLPQQGCHNRTGVGDDHLGLQLDQFFGELPHEYWVVGGPAVVNPKIAALQPSKLVKFPLQGRDV